MPTEVETAYLRMVWRQLMPPPMIRAFQPWTYCVSHSELLLRSPGQAGTATRVDVLFEAVKAMLLQYCYPSLALRFATPEEQARIESLGFEVLDPLPPYILSDDPLSFVIAGPTVHWSEGYGEHDEPAGVFGGRVDGSIRSMQDAACSVPSFDEWTKAGGV